MTQSDTTRQTPRIRAVLRRRPNLCLIRFFDTGHGNSIGAACFASPAENNHNELKATGDRETALGSRLYREGARHAAITPAIYCPPTVVGLHHADRLQILQREGASNPTLYSLGAKCRAAHFRMRRVWQANRCDCSSRVDIRTASLVAECTRTIARD
jgi:hypothetical protein